MNAWKKQLNFQWQKEETKDVKESLESSFPLIHDSRAAGLLHRFNSSPFFLGVEFFEKFDWSEVRSKA